MAAAPRCNTIVYFTYTNYSVTTTCTQNSVLLCIYLMKRLWLAYNALYRKHRALKYFYIGSFHFTFINKVQRIYLVTILTYIYIYILLNEFQRRKRERWPPPACIYDGKVAAQTTWCCALTTLNISLDVSLPPNKYISIRVF